MLQLAAVAFFLVSSAFADDGGACSAGDACDAGPLGGEDVSMIQLRGVSEKSTSAKVIQTPPVSGPVTGEGPGGTAGNVMHSEPYFFPNSSGAGPAPNTGVLIINEDGVNNTYYLPGAPTEMGGFRVKYLPPYRYYLMLTNTDDYSQEDNFYQLNLIGKTFSVDIEFHPDGPSCGCNVNLYLVNMPWSTPGSSGDYYCDAQCFPDHGCCAEFDINEGNMNVQQITNHACTPDGMCSKGGNPWDKTHLGQFGKENPSYHIIDSRKPFTYATKFEDTDAGFQTTVTMTQEGKTTTMQLGPNNGQMDSMREEIAKGMVFVTGYWETSNMNWLDGEDCGSGPETCNDHPAYISNWRITSNPTPGPTPPPPINPTTPKPDKAGYCCWNANCQDACDHDTGSFCNSGGQSMCEQSCGGHWC